jgi:hypothetical protein
LTTYSYNIYLLRPKKTSLHNSYPIHTKYNALDPNIHHVSPPFVSKPTTCPDCTYYSKFEKYA